MEVGNKAGPLHIQPTHPSPSRHKVRGLYPLELIPGMISFLAGKPAPQSFPITSMSLTIRSPFSTPSHPLPDIPVSVTGPALAEALQYNATRGIPNFIKWVEGLQDRFHGRNAKGEGWSCAVGTGSQDLLYKVRWIGRLGRTLR
jgi:tryptophan aminotransferase